MGLFKNKKTAVEAKPLSSTQAKVIAQNPLSIKKYEEYAAMIIEIAKQYTSGKDTITVMLGKLRKIGEEINDHDAMLLVGHRAARISESLGIGLSIHDLKEAWGGIAGW